MTLRYDRPSENVTIVHQWAGGITWMAHPDEEMQRASHALVDDGEVWLVDPLDGDGLDAEVGGLGTVAGVVVLTNSHGRDADRLADRHDVAVHVPACFDDPADDFDAPVQLIEDELAETGFELVWEKEGPGWKEGALYHPERRTLVVPDALMTCLFAGQDGRLEVFPLFKRSPPREELGGLAVDRILVGHGEPVVEGAEEALEEALSVSGWEATSSVVRSVPTFARIAYANIRG